MDTSYMQGKVKNKTYLHKKKHKNKETDMMAGGSESVNHRKCSETRDSFGSAICSHIFGFCQRCAYYGSLMEKTKKNLGQNF